MTSNCFDLTVRHEGVTYRAAFNEHGWTWVELPGVLGGIKQVGHGHPCRDGLGDGRVRVNAVAPNDFDSGFMLEVTDNEGKVLPDYRHPSQLVAY